MAEENKKKSVEELEKELAEAKALIAEQGDTIQALEKVGENPAKPRYLGTFEKKKYGWVGGNFIVQVKQRKLQLQEADPKTKKAQEQVEKQLTLLEFLEAYQGRSISFEDVKKEKDLLEALLAMRCGHVVEL